jgi:two-component system OmpR family response regulator
MTADFIVKGLREAGFAVDSSRRGDEGLLMASAYDYDLLIIDLMLPGMDGMTVIESLRKSRKDLGIIILSAKHLLRDKVKGLQTGADDYLTKPFDFIELLARVQALLRRKTSSPETTKLTFEDLELDLLTREVKRNGKKIELQQKEFCLLEYMMRNSNRIITRTMILEHVWDLNFDPSTNIVDVLVYRLREKIDRERSAKLINTVRGAGYVLKKN